TVKSMYRRRHMVATAEPELTLSRLRLGREVLKQPGLARELRERSDLTQPDFAHIVGATVSAISKYESGTRRPSGRIGRRYLTAIAELAATTDWGRGGS